MYGGDEVSAIVIDLGSHTCKAGYAGEDAPKAVFPSVVGAIDQMDVDESDDPEKNSGSGESKNNSRNVDGDKAKGKRKLYVGSQSLGYRRDFMEDGLVADWDIVDSIWDHAFSRECLLIDPKEHPMLLAEPSSNAPQQRERAAELMFEKYKAPALFLAKNAVLTSFASGRATSLVVDRNKKSLGYTVECSINLKHNVWELEFHIITPHHKPHQIQPIIQKYIDGLEEFLKKLDNKLFENYRICLVETLSKSDSLEEKTSKLWVEIIKYRCKFNFTHEVVRELEHIKKEQLIKFYKKYIQKSSTNCKRLWVNFDPSIEGIKEGIDHSLDEEDDDYVEVDPKKDFDYYIQIKIFHVMETYVPKVTSWVEMPLLCFEN